MRAILVRAFGEPVEMRLEEVAAPEPAAGQVRVAVKAAGVNPVDTYIRAGWYPSLPTLPYTPGLDGAGIVESVGAGVTTVKPGDRVYLAGSLTGTYAEKALCCVDQVHPLPEPVTFAQGAAIHVAYATSYQALFNRGRARPDETVLIHGASGGVGLAALQWARSADMTTIATAGSPQGLAILREQGATHVLDHHTSGHLNEARDLTGGRGVDLILEMLANVNLGDDLLALAKFGRVVVIGSRGPVEINPRSTMMNETSILGMSLSNATAAELTEINQAIASGLNRSVVQPVVGQELPLADAARAHQTVLQSGAHGKIVLIP